MNYTLLNPIRNFTRKIGLNRFIAQQLYKHRFSEIKKIYNEEKPSEVTLTTNGVTISMKVDDFSEYERVMSFKNDEKIIEAILEQILTKSDVVEKNR